MTPWVGREVQQYNSCKIIVRFIQLFMTSTYPSRQTCRLQIFANRILQSKSLNNTAVVVSLKFNVFAQRMLLHSSIDVVMV